MIMVENSPQELLVKTCGYSIKAGSCNWHFLTRGKFSKHILLLHGACSSSHTWGSILEELAEEYTVIAPDLPGHGLTTYKSKNVLNLDSMAIELALLKNALKIENFDFIIGHSAGAAIAVAYSNLNKKPEKIVGINPYFTRPSSIFYLFANLLPHFLSRFIYLILSRNIFMIDLIMNSSNTILCSSKKSKYLSLLASKLIFKNCLNFLFTIQAPLFLEKYRTNELKAVFIISEDDGWLPVKNLRKEIHKYFNRPSIITVNGGHLFHEGNEKFAVKIIRNALI